MFTPFRDILVFVLQYTPLSLKLSSVSSRFPHVPLGLCGWPLVYKERSCLANCPYFQLFTPTWSWCTNVTDGRTDRRTMCSINTALCTSASRLKKAKTDRPRLRPVHKYRKDCYRLFFGRTSSGVVSVVFLWRRTPSVEPIEWWPQYDDHKKWDRRLPQWCKL